MSNDQIWEIHEEIDCHSVNVIYYGNCKICNEKQAYIGKAVGENAKGFKVRISQRISDSKTRVSTCKFPGYVCDCDIKNICL